jgi:hypothetical protein
MWRGCSFGLAATVRLDEARDVIGAITNRAGTYLYSREMTCRGPPFEGPASYSQQLAGLLHGEQSRERRERRYTCVCGA